MTTSALHIFIAPMLNPSFKSSLMQEFSRFCMIIAGLAGYKISQLEIKKNPKIKTLKTGFFIKKNNKNVFYIYDLQCIRLHRRGFLNLNNRRTAMGSWRWTAAFANFFPDPDIDILSSRSVHFAFRLLSPVKTKRTESVDVWRSLLYSRQKPIDHQAPRPRSMGSCSPPNTIDAAE